MTILILLLSHPNEILLRIAVTEKSQKSRTTKCSQESTRAPYPLPTNHRQSYKGVVKMVRQRAENFE